MAAPTEWLTSGVHTLAANTVYALPGKICRVHITGAGAVEVSNDNSTWDTVTADANKEFITAAVFIRSTAGAIVSVKVT